MSKLPQEDCELSRPMRCDAPSGDDGTDAPPGRSFIDTAIASGVLIVITLLTGIMIARAVGPERRGSYGTVLFWSQLGVMVFSISAPDALIVRLRNRAQEPRLAVPVAIVLVLGLLVPATLVALGAGSVELVAIPELGSTTSTLLVWVLLAIGLLNQGLMAIETAGLEFSRVNLDRVLTPILFVLSVTVLAALDHASVLTLLVAFAAAKLPVIGARVWRFRRDVLRPIDWGLAREVIQLGPRLHLATAALALASQLDRIVVVSLWPSDRMGYYFVAFAAAGAGVSLASQAVQITLLPYLSGIADEAKREVTYRAFRLSLIAGGAVAVPVFLITPILVPLAYGQEFLPAVGYVQGLVIPMALVPAQWVINVANRSSGRGRPGVEMALATTTVYAATYVTTGFREPVHLFAAMSIANAASIAAGLRHIYQGGPTLAVQTLTPSLLDLRFLVGAGLRYAKRASSTTSRRGTHE